MSEMPVIDILSLGRGPGDLAPAAGRTPEQLKALAVQFESLLLSQMLRQMRQSMFDDDDKSTGFSDGPLADTVFAELSLALSRAGGVGVGKALLDPLMAATGQVSSAYAGAANDLSTSLASLPTSMAHAAAVSSASQVASGSAMATMAKAEPVLMPGDLSSSYGWRPDPLNGGMKFHKGVDLAMPVGQDVPSARRGEVVSTGELSGYGLTVVVKHDDRTSTRYAHLSRILVEPGQQVQAGQVIASSGATGRVTGPHLHFEVLREGQAIDPTGRW